MPLAAPRSAPRKSTASAISSDEREPAPSVSIAAVRLATPNLPAGSSALPLRTTRLTCATGTSCSLDDPDRQAVRQLPLLDGGQGQRRRRTRRRRLRAIGRLAGATPWQRGRSRDVRPMRMKLSPRTSHASRSTKARTTQRCLLRGSSCLREVWLRLRRALRHHRQLDAAVAPAGTPARRRGCRSGDSER